MAEFHRKMVESDIIGQVLGVRLHDPETLTSLIMNTVT